MKHCLKHSIVNAMLGATPELWAGYQSFNTDSIRVRSPRVREGSGYA
jgi:hypothetical protein